MGDAEPSFTHGGELAFQLQKKAPSAVPRELEPLLMMLTPSFTTDLRAFDTIVAELRAALRL